MAKHAFSQEGPLDINTVASLQLVILEQRGLKAEDTSGDGIYNFGYSVASKRVKCNLENAH